MHVIKWPRSHSHGNCVNKKGRGLGYNGFYSICKVNLPWKSFLVNSISKSIPSLSADSLYSAKSYDCEVPLSIRWVQYTILYTLQWTVYITILWLQQPVGVVKRMQRCEVCSPAHSQSLVSAAQMSRQTNHHELHYSMHYITDRHGSLLHSIHIA